MQPLDQHDALVAATRRDCTAHLQGLSEIARYSACAASRGRPCPELFDGVHRAILASIRASRTRDAVLRRAVPKLVCQADLAHSDIDYKLSALLDTEFSLVRRGLASNSPALLRQARAVQAQRAALLSRQRPSQDAITKFRRDCA